MYFDTKALKKIANQAFACYREDLMREIEAEIFRIEAEIAEDPEWDFCPRIQGTYSRYVREVRNAEDYLVDIGGPLLLLGAKSPNPGYWG